MEEDNTAVSRDTCNSPPLEFEVNGDGPSTEAAAAETPAISENNCISKEENGIVVENDDTKNSTVDCKESFVEHEQCEGIEDVRSVGDLDSLPVSDELALGAAGSDSGVEGCGRALSSGGGSRSCASSVVSCGSGCGSESSSVAGAPPRPRRRVNVTVAEPKRNSPIGCSTARPATAPRAPNLATRERARSREKPTPPEKPRPLTPKPRIRPATDLPNLVRESPALRAKPTKTSVARCRTPSSPIEDKRWPSNGPLRLTPVDATATRVAADKYGTLPRRRRDADADSSPKHESTPPSSRRPTITRSTSSRSTTKTRVRIYAEKTSQTVLLGTDVESALAGVVPNIESNRGEVSRCSRGVQASARDAALARLGAACAAAEAAAAAERERRLRAEALLAAERAARLAAIADLERNTQRLLELAGAGAGAGAEGCLRALEEQLRAAGELAADQRTQLDELRTRCEHLHAEASGARELSLALEARLAEAEREAAEMQDFLAAETGALTDSLRDCENELAHANKELERRRGECRQLVRMCEQRRQEALGAAAAARARGAGPALDALDALQRRLAALAAAVHRGYDLPPDEPTIYYNDAYSRSDSGEALSPEEECRVGAGGGGGLVACVSRALRAAPPLVAPPHHDDDRSEDNSADLLDSETEPCLVTDGEYVEEWWSGAEGEGEGEGEGESGEEVSPSRESCSSVSASVSERDSLRNLSAAIAQRQRSERGDAAAVLERALALDAQLTALLRALRRAASATDADAARLANALRDKIDVTEKNIADVVVKKLAELDASKNLMEQYKNSVEMLKNQLTQPGEEDDLKYLEQEVSSCSEEERRARHEAVAACALALRGAGAAGGVAALRARLERLAALLAAPPPSAQPTHRPHTLTTA